MRIIKIIIFFIMIFFSYEIEAKGNEQNFIESVNIEININDDKSATITQFWETTIYEGSELYLRIDEKFSDKIKNYKVSEQGEIYKFNENWKIYEDLTTKKNLYGINVAGEEKELCWGTGEYGYHKYKVEYDIEDFINEQNETKICVFNYNIVTPKVINIKMNGEILNNAFVKLQKSKGEINLAGDELYCKIDGKNFEDEVIFYINYNGDDWFQNDDETIVIKRNNKKEKNRSVYIISVGLLISMVMIFVLFKEVQKFKEK